MSDDHLIVSNFLCMLFRTLVCSKHQKNLPAPVTYHPFLYLSPCVSEWVGRGGIYNRNMAILLSEHKSKAKEFNSIVHLMPSQLFYEFSCI